MGVTGSDLKRKAIGRPTRTGSALSMKRQEEFSAPPSGRFLNVEDGWRQPPDRNGQIPVLPAVITEHEQKVKANHKKQEARLEVHSTAKKVVPGPGILGERHGNQLNDGERQEKAVNVFESPGQQCRTIVTGPIYVRSTIQEFLAFSVDGTPSDELNRPSIRCGHWHSALRALKFCAFARIKSARP